MSHLFSGQASLRMSLVMKNVIVNCNYIPCIQGMRDIMVSCLSGPPYQWCKHDNSKGADGLFSNLRHIGCCSTLSWLTFLCLGPKVKATASEKVMIFIHLFQSAFLATFLKLNPWHLVRKDSLVVGSTLLKLKEFGWIVFKLGTHW